MGRHALNCTDMHQRTEQHVCACWAEHGATHKTARRTGVARAAGMLDT